MCTSDGPADRDLMARLRAAMAHWEAIAETTAVTSQITGGGAVAAVERLMSSRHGGRPAMLLPSATYALRVALQTVGVGVGDEVLLPVLDWPSGVAAVRSLGAYPRFVEVDRQTMTISPEAARRARTTATRAAIACHLHGVPADVPALRDFLPGVAIVEDCAQALGSTLDGRPVGTLGDVAVFSFGPGKRVDAGEGGMLLVAEAADLRDAAVHCAHPVRQLTAGVSRPAAANFAVRPHPVAAILALHGLAQWDPAADRGANAELVARLARQTGVRLLGVDGRRANGSAAVPVVADESTAHQGAGYLLLPSGVLVLDRRANARMRRLAATVRLAVAVRLPGHRDQVLAR